MSSENTDKGLEIIQTKLDEHEFAFDEQMWVDMEEKLDSEKSFTALKWRKLLALLFLTPIRLSAALLLTAGAIYFFTKPTLGKNTLSENTINTTPSNTASTASTENKTKNTFSTKKEEVSKTRTLNTQSESSSNASKFKNDSKPNENIFENSKKRQKSKVSDEFTTLEESAIPKIENQILSKKEAKNNNEAISPYTQNSSSSITLVVEEIPSKMIAVLSPFEEVPEFNKPRLPKETKWHWGITGGVLIKPASLFLGGLSENHYYGITANRKIKANWKLGLTLNFKRSRFSTPIEFSYSDSVSTSYGSIIGRYTQEREIHFIDYIEGIINLQYSIPQLKSTLKIGIKPSYAINLKTTGIQDHSNYYPFSRVNIINTTLFQKYSGIRRFSLGLSIGYEYKINPRWSIDIKYTQGLIDQSIDNFYKNKLKHFNSDLQLGFVYRLK